jgi:peptide deformylase
VRALLGARQITVALGAENHVPLEIVQVGNPVLRRQARPLSLAEITQKETKQLIEQMRETMLDAPGVGLAAPQVGLSLQIAVIEDREEYQREVPPEQLLERDRKPVPFHVIINPRILELGAEKAEFFEGCLSLRGFSAIVSRARSVRVECLDEHGKQRVIEASGWHARILQHEIDHLAGTLYFDRMISRTFTSIDHWTQYWKGKPVGEILSELKVDPKR